MARARTKKSPPHAPDADGQVRAILEEMQAGTWAHGSAGKLAKRWGISVNSVRDRASEAARHLRLKLDPQATLDQAIAQLEEMKLGAMAAGEWGPAMKGAELWFRVRRFLDAKEPQLPTFPSARAALLSVRELLPGLEQAAAAETANQLPAGPGATKETGHAEGEEEHQEAREENHQDDQEGRRPHGQDEEVRDEVRVR